MLWFSVFCLVFSIVIGMFVFRKFIEILLFIVLVLIMVIFFILCIGVLFGMLGILFVVCLLKNVWCRVCDLDVFISLMKRLCLNLMLLLKCFFIVVCMVLMYLFGVGKFLVIVVIVLWVNCKKFCGLLCLIL